MKMLFLRRTAELPSRGVATPKLRKLYSRLHVKAPSPYNKKEKITLEEIRLFSIAVHLYASMEGIKLDGTRLMPKDFQEITRLFGPLHDRQVIARLCRHLQLQLSVLVA